MPVPSCLVVDPDPAFADVLAEIIGCHGFQTIVLHDPVAGLSEMRRHAFDLIIFDLSNTPDAFKIVFETIRRELPQMMERIVIVSNSPLVSADMPVGVPVVGKNDLKPLMAYLKR